jgi:REP element-mobilizing transposase RayT
VATPPRLIVPGATYLITRRCSERRFFLRPDDEVNPIVQYVVAVAAARYGVAIHACSALSNHLHLVVTDRQGRLPDFTQYIGSQIARAVNSVIGHWEAFWDSDGVSQVILETPDAILEKMTYVLSNPVSAGLVRRSADWPGVWSAPELIGAAAVTVKRPTAYFNPDGYMPEALELELSRPPGFEDDEQFVETLIARLRDAEDAAAAALGSEGRSFLGRRRVLAQNPFARPRQTEPRRQLKPRVACRNKWKRIEALQRLAAFVDAYRAALAAWRAGDRSALFPAGTWLMRVQHGAACCATG